MVLFNFIKQVLGLPTLISLIYLNIMNLSTFHSDQFIVTNVNVKENVYIISYLLLPLDILYLYYLYNNRYYYINSILNSILQIKMFIQNRFKIDDNNFIIGKILLYTDLNQNIEVTQYFKKNKIKYIDKNLIRNMYAENMMIINAKDAKDANIRLKIFYRFQGNNYIMYYPYSCSNNYIPFPPYSKEIMESYRNDLIIPTYTKIYKKRYIYPIFSTECKDIAYVNLNSNNDEALLNYFNKIKGPFNDFGILYKTPILLKWILVENNININNFETLYIKFLSVYFDETDYELKDHYIDMNKDMLDNILISKRIKNILLEMENDKNIK